MKKYRIKWHDSLLSRNHYSKGLLNEDVDNPLVDIKAIRQDNYDYFRVFANKHKYALPPRETGIVEDIEIRREKVLQPLDIVDDVKKYILNFYIGYD